MGSGDGDFVGLAGSGAGAVTVGVGVKDVGAVEVMLDETPPVPRSMLDVQVSKPFRLWGEMNVLQFGDDGLATAKEFVGG